eukprot:7462047-Ditylum_brightwellii.AAC.1
MRKPLSNDNAAPPCPPTCPSSRPPPPPPPKKTSDELFTSILRQTEALMALRNPCPEVLQLIEHTKQLNAQHQEYCLWKAEHCTITALPCLLHKLRSTVPIVPPSCVTKPLPIPITGTKYAFATAQLLGLRQKGPVSSPSVMSIDYAPFWHTPPKLLHHNQPFMLQSQHHARHAGFGCLDTSHQAHRPPPVPNPPHHIFDQACSTLMHITRPPPESDPVL